MAYKAIVAGIAATLVAGPVFAGTKADRHETAGVGIGAVVGAAAGGPLGVIVGAAAGGWLGDTFGRKSAEVETLTVALVESRSRNAALESRVAGLGSDVERMNDEIDRLRSIARPELLSLLKAGIGMDLLFRTDEHVLADATSSRLRALAGTLATMPELRIQLDGYADERGATDYNQQLSGMRAVHVRDILVDAGVPTSRIEVTAHGESTAADGNIDSLALERRVSLTLSVAGAPAVAANPQ